VVRDIDVRSKRRLRGASADKLTLRLRSLVEGDAHHQIDRGRSFVSRNKSIAKMAHEVVVGCLGMRARVVAEAACYSRFHFKPRKFAGNSLDFIWRDEVELQADDIQTDAGGAHITSDSL
jgi:hypothetical protein